MHGAHEGGPGRRARLTRDIMIQTGIDEAMIERLVRGFYQRVQSDPLLGPVFAEKITDWEAHISKLREFWSSVALMSGRYHGQPMQSHLSLPIASKHFDRWLSVFEQTAKELCPPKAAGHFVERARRIAASLQAGIAMQKRTIERPCKLARREKATRIRLLRDDAVFS